MDPSRSHGRWRSLLSMFLTVSVVTTVIAPPTQEPQDPTAPFPRAGKYAGKNDCRECHEDEWDAIATGYHREVIDNDALRGCENCHGPGLAHADDEDQDPRLITYPPGLSAARQPAVCGQCHRAQIATHGGDPEGFVWAGKGCTDCHKVHEAIPDAPHPELAFASRADAQTAAERVGARTCIGCHPIRNRLLAHSHHQGLAAGIEPEGCENCHGPGSLHVETGGLARLISRPDRARDGVATCRSCHTEVDPQEFHWRGVDKPLLSANLTCTRCHQVHRAIADEAPRKKAVDRDTGTSLAGANPATNKLCAGCHQPAFQVLRGTIHAELGDLDLPLSIGCGGCHAGGEEHARNGGRKDLVTSMHGSSAAEQFSTCTACHQSEPTLRHVRVGSHHRNEVSCLSCHSPTARVGRVRDDAEKKCASCHQAVSAEFRQPNRHPVPDGHMGCSDCHNAHESRPKLHNRVLNQTSCMKCHKEYRGPFVFAHQATRLDGCVICHTPHGSSNRRMLRQATTQQNCTQCHADYPAFHNQSPGSVFTNCLNCHTEIHGSNHSRYFFR